MGDYELLLLLKQNPEQGIKQLTEQYVGLVYSIINGRAGSIATVQDMEECVSDVIFELFQSCEKVDLSKGSIKAYISVIARKRAINLYKIKTKEMKRTSTSEIFDVMTDAAGFDDAISDMQERQSVIEAIQSLGEPDSAIIIRKYYFGQKSKEIAADMGMTISAVDTRLSRAMNKLRELIGGRH